MVDEKVTNILTADIENLAQRRGEDAVAWAISAVVDAEAATAEEALALGVIDFVAVSVTELPSQKVRLSSVRSTGCGSMARVKKTVQAAPPGGTIKSA